MSWPLVDKNDDGIRPAGKQDECFYCNRKIGELHGPKCVIVQRKIKIRYIYEIELEVPYFWDKEKIEFHRNDGTWCADNSIEELEKFLGTDDGMTPCLCHRFKAEFISDLDMTPIRHLKND